MSDVNPNEVRGAVRERYGAISSNGSCCGTPKAFDLSQVGSSLGYSIQELSTLPAGANLGLGCGNPQAIAALKAGETVVDLGSGAGIDCFLAARSVGETGSVIGVDMTVEMLAAARKNAQHGGFSNVQFRLGEIEHLPIADNSVDVIISNCVINLSPEKLQVFREAFRVLRHGGRLAISDMVASGPIPADLKADLNLHTRCIVGATPLAELEAMLVQSGFTQIRIEPKSESRSFVKDWAPGTGIEDYILSATIEAVKM